MEEGKVIYFYWKEGVRYKKHRWSRGELPVLEIDMGEGGKLGCCGVPWFYRKGKNWESGRLAEVLSGKLEEQKAEDYYLHPDIALQADVKEKMPPEILLRKVFGQVPCLEYLIYVGWGGEYREGAFGEEAFGEERWMLYRLLKPYLARVNHFTLLTDRPEGYEEFTEYIYEEYGIPAASVEKMENGLGKPGKTVILDGRKEYLPPWQIIPPRAAYVDLWSMREKREQAEKLRRDVKYISVVKFLDTLVKNGYNTIVN